MHVHDQGGMILYSSDAVHREFLYMTTRSYSISADVETLTTRDTTSAVTPRCRSVPKLDVKRNPFA